MPTIGETAPDFELTNQDGQKVKLSDYRGKKVILFAFPQAYTMGCEAQVCGFRDQFPKIEAKGAVVLGVSPDKPEILKQWTAERGLQYDLLSDPNHTALDAWHAWGKTLLGIIKLPRTRRSYWVMDENGVVIDMQVGVLPADSVKRALAAVGG
jgi:thioredoxin-dependent peroxiredoxin